MGWQKGRKRGESPLKGKKMLDVDPRYIGMLLDDNSEPPEVRFTSVMEILLNSMQESRNGTIAQVGQRLRAFWDRDMEKTIIFTPTTEG